MELWRRIDQAWARWEGRAIVAVLLSMVFVASFSAGVRNLTRFDIQWANHLLMDMEWADSFLRKGTMWLAFIGASLATHYRKHISIDLLTRIAPLKAKYTMHAVAGVSCGIITFGLAYAFASACYLNLTERPIEYEMLGDNGSMHVCDATAAQVKALEDFSRPAVFCVVRTVLKTVGIPAETPGAAFQIIVPLMFIAIGLRFLMQGIEAGVALARGPEEMERMEREDRERLAVVHASVSGAPPAAGAGGDSTGGPSAGGHGGAS
jgi:TRAP-type C4-dicarboxylate transport system permease small subunit